MPFNNWLHVPRATVTVTHRALGLLRDPEVPSANPYSSRKGSRPFLGTDLAGEGQVLAASFAA